MADKMKPEVTQDRASKIDRQMMEAETVKCDFVAGVVGEGNGVEMNSIACVMASRS